MDIQKEFEKYAVKHKGISGNTLHSYLGLSDFNSLDIDPGLRAENLSVAQFVAISNFLTLSTKHKAT